MSKETQRHYSLPDHFNDQELAAYIKKVAVSKHEDVVKRYYTPEEIADMEHESANSGREVMRLEAIIDIAKEAVKKGIDEDLTIVIPATSGTKNLGNYQSQNYQMIEAGFEEIKVDIFGIVNQEKATMEFFTLAGELMEERTRPLSAKEKKDHLQARRMAPSGAKLSIDESVDFSTGEMREGTNG
jgi:hypothetical protein